MTGIDRQQAFSGTKDAAGALALDAARLEAYLAQHVAGFAGPLTIKQFKGGQSNPTYLLETPARRYVLAPQAARQTAAVGARRRPRISRDQRAARTRFPGRRAAGLLRGRERRRHAVLCDELRDGRVFWEPQMPASNATERAAIYDAMNATHRAPAQLRSGRNRPRRFRPRRKLRRAPGRALVETVSRLRDRTDRRHGAADRLAAAAHSAARPARLVHGDYRLDNLIIAKDAAGHPRGARLGTVHARRSARRLHLSSDGVAHAAFGERGRHRRRWSGMILQRSAFRRWRTMSTPTSRAPGSTVKHTN